jgi:hypothetical protein
MYDIFVITRPERDACTLGFSFVIYKKFTVHTKKRFCATFFGSFRRTDSPREQRVRARGSSNRVMADAIKCWMPTRTMAEEFYLLPSLFTEGRTVGIDVTSSACSDQTGMRIIGYTGYVLCAPRLPACCMPFVLHTACRLTSSMPHSLPCLDPCSYQMFCLRAGNIEGNRRRDNETLHQQ